MKIPTRVYMFQERFVLKVRAGFKIQTIRPMRKRLPKVGDRVSCRCWSELPYRSKQVVLCSGVITEISRIYIGPNITAINGVVLAEVQLQALAIDDGFTSWTSMYEWFSRQYDLPFKGFITKWKNEYLHL